MDTKPESDALSRNVVEARFAAGSPEIATLLAAIDWSSTAVGIPEAWSPALRTMLNVALANRFPMVFWWGPELVQFYNEPYTAILGTKHPSALGQTAIDCWAEIWDVIGPQIVSVYRTGESTWNEDLLLDINRYGFVEETYFTFSYSPLPDPQAANGIGGVLATVQETSDKVVGERRMRLLRDLAACSTLARSAQTQLQLFSAAIDNSAKACLFRSHFCSTNRAPSLIWVRLLA